MTKHDLLSKILNQTYQLKQLLRSVYTAPIQTGLFLPICQHQLAHYATKLCDAVKTADAFLKAPTVLQLGQSLIQDPGGLTAPDRRLQYEIQKS